MTKVKLDKSIITTRWRIPDKFINYDFAAFIDNTFPKSEGRKKVEFRTLVGFNSGSDRHIISNYRKYMELLWMQF